MKVNPALTPLDNVKQLILASNPAMDLSAAKLTFGSPEAGSFAGGRNTRIKLTALANKGYSGEKYVYYIRRALANNLKAGAPSIVLNAPGETLAAWRTKVLGLLGLIASDVSWSSTSLPTGGNTSVHTITAIAGSLIYQPGTTVQVTAQHYAAVAEFVITAGASANTQQGDYMFRGSRGYVPASGVGFSMATGSCSPSSVPMSPFNFAYLASYNDVAGDTFDPAISTCISLGVHWNSSTQVHAVKSLVKKIEMFLEDTSGKPLFMEQFVTAATRFGAGLAGNSLFPSRWDFARGAVARPVAGVRYRCKVYYHT